MRMRSAQKGPPPKKGSEAKKTSTFCGDVTHNITGCDERKGHGIKLTRAELEFRNVITEPENPSSSEFPVSATLSPDFDDAVEKEIPTAKWLVIS